MSDGMDEWPFYDLTIEEVEEKKTKKKTIKCSACGQPGHNKASKKCPKVPVDIRHVAPPPNEITQSNLCPSEDTTVSSSDVVLNSSQFEVSKCRNCLFCNQFLGLSSSGRPLLFCSSCQTLDPLRCPIQIPTQLSPSSFNTTAFALREFTLKLKTGKWSITPFWKFFFSKNPKLRRMSGLAKKQNVNKVVRRLLLRGHYSSAMNSLFSSSIAPNDEQTLLALKKLHPVEEFQLSKPEAHSFWSDTPISKNEVDDINSCLPHGKAAGPSKLTFDILKDCTSAQSVISEDLACFFQNLMMLSCKAPLEMSASRLVALIKSGGGVRPNAVGESLFRLLSMLIFKRITNTARTHLSPFQFGIVTIDGASIASLI
ncbi:hypothetical protein RCL1_008974 [Eukaryota sp. TZLM3-RCL]